MAANGLRETGRYQNGDTRADYRNCTSSGNCEEDQLGRCDKIIRVILLTDRTIAKAFPLSSSQPICGCFIYGLKPEL